MYNYSRYVTEMSSQPPETFDVEWLKGRQNYLRSVIGVHEKDIKEIRRAIEQLQNLINTKLNDNN